MNHSPSIETANRLARLRTILNGAKRLGREGAFIHYVWTVERSGPELRWCADDEIDCQFEAHEVAVLAYFGTDDSMLSLMEDDLVYVNRLEREVCDYIDSL